MDGFQPPDPRAAVAGWRGHVCAHPEFAGQAKYTARLIAARLTGSGVECQTGIVVAPWLQAWIGHLIVALYSNMARNMDPANSSAYRHRSCKVVL